MTELEKMQQGLLYDANNDPDLIAQRLRCKDLCFALNQLKPPRWPSRKPCCGRSWAKPGNIFPSPPPSGATTGITSRSGTTSTPTTTA